MIPTCPAVNTVTHVQYVIARLAVGIMVSFIVLYSVKVVVEFEKMTPRTMETTKITMIGIMTTVFVGTKTLTRDLGTMITGTTMITMIGIMTTMWRTSARGPS